MASVYKRHSSKAWQIAWTGHEGRRHTQSSKTTDKREAECIGKDLEAAAALRRKGVVDGPRSDSH
jgi:hypothetical protein